VRNTSPLHLRILSDPDFVAGRLSTAFMERFLTEKKPADGRLAEAV
jgi:biotin carboxylase